VLGDISASSSSSSSSDGLLTGPVYMFGRFWMSGAVLCCAVGLDESRCAVLSVQINRQGIPFEGFQLCAILQYASAGAAPGPELWFSCAG
jgi:hypothetical protein